MAQTMIPPHIDDRLAATVELILEVHRRSWGRDRWRSLVERIDAVIDECEREHLADATVPSTELEAWGLTVLGATVGAVAERGHPPVLSAVLEAAARRHATIVELMDALWAAQDAVFDVLMPSRRVLPVDVHPVAGLPRCGGQEDAS